MDLRHSDSNSDGLGRAVDALPEWFWTRQRQAVLAAAAAAAPRRPRWTAIGAIAVMAALAITAIWPLPARQPLPQITKEDERLLERVNDTVTRIEPRAMDVFWAQP